MKHDASHGQRLNAYIGRVINRDQINVEALRHTRIVYNDLLTSKD